jgi:uncharacterized protein YneF (UPF0154 family)
MKNKKLLITIIILALLSGGFWVYRTYFQYKTTESGLKYRFLKGKELGMILNGNNWCLINYMILGPAGDTIQSSYGNDTFVEVPYPTTYANELTEALQMASQGSKVELLVSTDSLKKKNSSHYKVQLLPDGEMAKVIFDVEKILGAQDYYQYLANKSFKKTMKENKAIDEYCAKAKGNRWYLDTYAMVKYRAIGSDSFLSNTSNLLQNAAINKSAEQLEFDVLVTRLNGDLIFDSRLENRKYKTDVNGMINPIIALNRLPFFVPSGVTMEFVITSDMGFGSAGRIGVPAYSPLYLKVYNVKPIQ